MQYLLGGFVCMLLTSCGPVCERLETRCANDVVEICDSRGRWQTVLDCRTVSSEPWSCVFDGDDHTCIEVMRNATYYKDDGC